MSFKKEKLAFWGDGVERRSVTLGYTMETGEYAEENDQVLFCGNLPAVVFDFEDRHKAESMPVATRPLALLKRKPRPRPDEWKQGGQATILGEATEDYDIAPIRSIFGTQHHKFGYTIGGRDMNEWTIMVKYILVFMDAFKKGEELAGDFPSYIKKLLKELGGRPVVVVAKSYTKPKERKVLGFYRAPDKNDV